MIPDILFLKHKRALERKHVMNFAGELMQIRNQSIGTYNVCDTDVFHKVIYP